MTVRLETIGGVTIGNTVVGGTPNEILFIDGAGNLGQDAKLTWTRSTSKLTSAITTLSSGYYTFTFDPTLSVYPGVMPDAPIICDYNDGAGTHLQTMIFPGEGINMTANGSYAYQGFYCDWGYLSISQNNCSVALYDAIGGTATDMMVMNRFTDATTFHGKLKSTTFEAGSAYINSNSTTALLVERDTVNDNVLVVDTTNARVGVNCQPSYPFHLTLPASASNGLYIEGTTYPYSGTASMQALYVNRHLQRTINDNGTTIAALTFLLSNFDTYGATSGKPKTISQWCALFQSLRQNSYSGSINASFLNVGVYVDLRDSVLTGLTITSSADVGESAFGFLINLIQETILNNAALDYVTTQAGISADCYSYVTNTASNSYSITVYGAKVFAGYTSGVKGTAYGGHFSAKDQTTNYGVYAEGATAALWCKGHIIWDSANAYDIGTTSVYGRDIFTAGKHYFRDSAIHIASANDGYLDLTADTDIRINNNLDVIGVQTYENAFTFSLTASASSEAVTFPTSFAGGVTPVVVCTPGYQTSFWVTSISNTGFTFNVGTTNAYAQTIQCIAMATS